MFVIFKLHRITSTDETEGLDSAGNRRYIFGYFYIIKIVKNLKKTSEQPFNYFDT